jgi:hypothetical protein
VHVIVNHKFPDPIELPPYPFCDNDVLTLISHYLTPVMPLVFASKHIANSLVAYRAMLARAKFVARTTVTIRFSSALDRCRS